MDRAPAICRHGGPPLSRNLRDSAAWPPYSVGAADAGPPAFQRSLSPARSLVPERFRGPVAPSAAAEAALSRAGCAGHRDHDRTAPGVQPIRCEDRQEGRRLRRSTGRRPDFTSLRAEIGCRSIPPISLQSGYAGSGRGARRLDRRVEPHLELPIIPRRLLAGLGFAPAPSTTAVTCLPASDCPGFPMTLPRSPTAVTCTG